MIIPLIAALAAPIVATVGYLGTEVVIESNQQTMHQWLHPSWYSGVFPQDAFPCKPEHQTDYRRLVKKGYKKMRSQTVVIAGLARNIADNFEKIKERIEETGSFFKEYVVLIFENDSDDQTRELLKQWATQNSRVKLIEVPGTHDGKLNLPYMRSYGLTSPKRVEKMAYFRNLYLKEVQTQYQHFDYMLVVDTNLKGPWNNEGLAHTIAHDDWDAVASLGLLNQFGTAGTKLIMYDVLAYVSYKETFKLNIDESDIQEMNTRYNKQLKGIAKGDPMTRVRSAFGGMAIYKIPSLKGCSYKPTRCEHIGLHEQMAAHRRKIFMNPAQIILIGYRGQPNFLSRWRESYRQRIPTK